MVNELSGNLKPYSYGNILRAGNLPNGRVVYQVMDSTGEEAGKLSLPPEQVDTFEASYQQILKTAPKIKAYVDANSSEESIKKRKNVARGVIGASGVVGAAVPLMIFRNSSSVTKKILGVVTGIVAGLSAGFISSLSVTTPPGSFEFAKATRSLAKLDIQPVLDEEG